MSLDSFIQSFKVQPPPAGRIVAGTPIDLIAAPTEILDIPDVEVVSGEVDLKLVFKHVQLPPESGVTPWPPPATVTSLVTDVSSGLAAPPRDGSIEGWLATVTGRVPVGLRDITEQIQIDFRWVLTDLDTGLLLSDVSGCERRARRRPGDLHRPADCH